MELTDPKKLERIREICLNALENHDALIMEREHLRIARQNVTKFEASVAEYENVAATLLSELRLLGFNDSPEGFVTK
jgi:hypothetical protein